MNKRKFNLSGIAAFIISVLILVVIVPINIIANYCDKNFDMTPDKMYSLSDTTVNIIEKNKDKKIEIYFMYTLNEIRDFTENLPLYHTLVQLREFDNIELTDIKPDENPALIEELNPNGVLQIGKGDIIVKCGDTIKKIDLAKVFPYNSDTGVTDYAGEELIAGALQIVTGGKLPTVYFLTGHGEKSIDSNYSTFAEILRSDNYEAAELNLSETGAVPDDAAILFLAGPQTDISDEEKEIILDYTENGGSLAFFLAPVEDGGRFVNIEEILADYELGMDYNVVKETNSDKMMYNNKYETDPYTFNVLYTPATDSFTVDLTTEINSLIEEGGIGGISNTRSFYKITGNESEFIEKSSIITNSPDDSGLYYTESIPCGGDDETADAAKELSNMQLELGYYSCNKQNGSKLLAIGTTDVLDSEAVSASISFTQQLVLNSVVWLYNSDIDMQIGSKSAAFDHMKFSDSQSATSVIRIFTIVPICIAALGLIVWLKRRHS